MSGEPTDFYDVLGVTPDVDAAGLRRAYVALARRNHPDVAGESSSQRAAAERAMQRINEAWSVLGDADRRQRYDRQLAADRLAAWEPGTASPGFVPFDEGDDPDDPAAEHDVPYGDGSPVPRSLQVGPVAIVVLGLVALGAGTLLGFGPLIALGVVGLVVGGLAFAAAPVYAVMRSSRSGLD